MSVIEEYLAAYERQFDYWEGAAQRARLMLEAGMNSSGLRAIATSRAKSVDRLAEKVRQRNKKKHYRTVEEITKDVVDLAGVRVALYFPGQTEEAEQLIRSLFNVEGEKKFPRDSPPRREEDRFSGYAARHFRVRIPEGVLPEQEIRYSTALIEIQVASVLMHAWSEVEHDLVYKPLDGELSSAEYALLDQLNGLVLAGEIALEQLQLAGDRRVAEAETPFRDHFELAEFLRSQRSIIGHHLTDAALGRVDILFEFLSEQDLARAKAIAPYLEQLDNDFEQRPVAEQLSDLMLSGDLDKYEAYRRATSAARHPSGRNQPETFYESNEHAVAFEQFIRTWAEFEQALAVRVPSERRRPLASTVKAALEHDVIDDETFRNLRMLQDMRNRLVHGPQDNHGTALDVPMGRLTWAVNFLRQLINEFQIH
ncbi:RelA/SpoT domain-containing protein [Kribbella qitaiheensis]|uniref:RelA/SpoT domain-containing protein n=1 Tax=Kribbella qitaiheensis TaxID=1544730 RepID=A0A7G6X1I2_9ACTN|nr:RelA/SpoT domain-containing protein [Kribbella qitaiheensis]QNE20097.1 RelA/SpoT domain-containing protein [Kribbella qitaiheensis]